MHGFTELILLVIIIVIIFGPSTAPKLGEAIGKMIKRSRKGGGEGSSSSSDD